MGSLSYKKYMTGKNKSKHDKLWIFTLIIRDPDFPVAKIRIMYYND